MACSTWIWRDTILLPLWSCSWGNCYCPFKNGGMFKSILSFFNVELFNDKSCQVVNFYCMNVQWAVYNIKIKVNCFIYGSCLILNFLKHCCRNVQQYYLAKLGSGSFHNCNYKQKNSVLWKKSTNRNFRGILFSINITSKHMFRSRVRIRLQYSLLCSTLYNKHQKLTHKIHQFLY